MHTGLPKPFNTTTMKTMLLNPFSVSLKKHPFMEMTTEPVFVRGDYRVFKYFNTHFVHAFKNIVIAERGSINKEMIENLIQETKPQDEAKLFHDYERPKQAIADGIKAAKELNFNVS
jgi:hypothetical protein